VPIVLSNGEQLIKLAFALARTDHFCEGFLAAAYSFFARVGETLLSFLEYLLGVYEIYEAPRMMAAMDSLIDCFLSRFANSGRCVRLELGFLHALSQSSDGSAQIIAARPKCPGKNRIGRVRKIMKARALFLGVNIPIEKIDGTAEGDDECSDLRHLSERCLQLVHDSPRVCSV
jgi:hypothetical protein